MPPSIRALDPSDQSEVGHMAYQTGFFGESARRFFPAKRLFELLWVGPYFESGQSGQLRQGSVGFVAQDESGQLLGYIIGMTDQARYQQALVQTLGHGLPKALAPLPELWPSLRYLARSAFFQAPHANMALYPAHLHLNLLPQARGLRLGQALLSAYLQALDEQGVCGIHLSTTSENRAAVALYQKFGFEVAASKVTALWTPWLGHPAEHLLMVRQRRTAAKQATVAD